ncbi:Predicted arabinose efflux permease, MFS family [Kaistia soli DSM 19436]|uniref:Predicted arabinose efflux permease, MFS family n=1 Tax=Kaistia soli DSM 19436 TaxID=1122133 RepID=A0A1M5K2A6_9HYPH|nr:MFS transporter [Kaistia soli]SHG46700.1 Predicted arabinose efflux permease, MFS family [Kaistia soli DSM 19436]
MTAIAAPGRRLLDGNDYKTLALSALGGALEFYDFIIFVFFVTVLGHLFFPPEIPEWVAQLQAFGIFAAGYLARPLGGLIMAHFGDKLGRKRMFTLSILLMALSTLGIAALPTYATIGIAAPILLLAMRVLQGAAIGGEVPGAWTFVSEHVPVHRIGLACGILTCGLTAGILLGSLIATAVNYAFSADDILSFAWRFPFLLGGVFGLVAVYLRRWLEETPVFKEMKARKQLAAELPLKAVLRDHKSATVLSMLLTWMLSGAIVVAILMTPTLLQTLYKIPAKDALTANSIATLFLTLGCVLAGLTVDKVGAGRFFTIGSLFFGAATYYFYSSVASDPASLYPLAALAGFSVGVIGAVPYVMVKAFPAAVRFTGVSFAYNIAYAIFGGLTPLMVTLALKSDPMAHAHYLAFLSLLGAGIGLYLWSKDQH